MSEYSAESVNATSRQTMNSILSMISAMILFLSGLPPTNADPLM